MNIEKQVMQLVIDASNKTEAEIKSAANWQEAGLDSLQTVELIMLTEDAFSITIEDEEAETIKCFDDLVNFIKGKK